MSASQVSVRKSYSNSMRSTLSSNLVNEARVGYSSAPVTFYPELTKDLFGGTSVADQRGFHLTSAPSAPALTQSLRSVRRHRSRATPHEPPDRETR